jgi:predicted TIM-barrel fold metal-dependent hydrolase
VTGPLIDVNVSLSRWPARRIHGDEPAELAAMLKARGVTEAWAGSFDALLHKDVAAVNTRLAKGCRAQNDVRLVPFGTVNPLLPDWEDDVRRCAEEHHMPGIRLHPNYHGYKLDHPAFARLLALAAERRLLVQIAVIMEDARMMHPLLRVPPVDVAQLPALVRKITGLRVILLNALSTVRGETLQSLRGSEISVEIAMLEGVNGVANLLDQLPADRVLFGSHAPLFYVEAAILKLKESPLPGPQLKAVRSENARRLFNPTN